MDQNTNRIHTGMAGYLTDHEVRRYRYNRVHPKHPLRYRPKTWIRRKLEEILKFILLALMVYASFWMLCFIAATA